MAKVSLMFFRWPYEPRRVADVLGAQALPPAWVATVIDRADRVVARSRQFEEFLRKVAPEELRRAAKDKIGIWDGLYLEGAKVLGGYAQSDLTGWRAFVGVPSEIVAAAASAIRLDLGGAGGCPIHTRVSSRGLVWAAHRVPCGRSLTSGPAAGQGRGRFPCLPLVWSRSIRWAANWRQLPPSFRARVSPAARARAASAPRMRMRQLALSRSIRRGASSPSTRPVQLTGHTREELIGNHFGFSTNRPDLVRDVELFQQQVAGERDAYTVENQFTRKDGTGGWVRVSCTAVRDASGKFLYAVRIVEDITERKQAEERQKLLIDELNHRVKNTLATVQSLAWQSARQGVSPEAAQERFQGRLLALSRTHNLLNETLWEGACLKEVIRVELEPYASNPGRVRSGRS